MSWLMRLLGRRHISFNFRKDDIGGWIAEHYGDRFRVQGFGLAPADALRALCNGTSEWLGRKIRLTNSRENDVAYLEAIANARIPNYSQTHAILNRFTDETRGAIKPEALYVTEEEYRLLDAYNNQLRGWPSSDEGHRMIKFNDVPIVVRGK